MTRDKREKSVGGGGGERRVVGQQFLARADCTVQYSSLSAAPVRDRDFVAQKKVTITGLDALEHSEHPHGG